MIDVEKLIKEMQAQDRAFNVDLFHRITMRGRRTCSLKTTMQTSCEIALALVEEEDGEVMMCAGRAVSTDQDAAIRAAIEDALQGVARHSAECSLYWRSFFESVGI